MLRVLASPPISVIVVSVSGVAVLTPLCSSKNFPDISTSAQPNHVGVREYVPRLSLVVVDTVVPVRLATSFSSCASTVDPVIKEPLAPTPPNTAVAPEEDEPPPPPPAGRK